MKNLKIWSVVLLVMGVIAIIYGWTQTWGFGAHTSVFEQVLLERTIRTYVFITSGIILIIISFIVDKLVKALKEVEKSSKERQEVR